jgi:hypothetical protein
VLIAIKKLRFLSNLMELDQSIAKNALENADLKGTEYQKIIQG